MLGEGRCAHRRRSPTNGRDTHRFVVRHCRRQQTLHVRVHTRTPTQPEDLLSVRTRRPSLERNVATVGRMATISPSQLCVNMGASGVLHGTITTIRAVPPMPSRLSCAVSTCGCYPSAAETPNGFYSIGSRVRNSRRLLKARSLGATSLAA